MTDSRGFTIIELLVVVVVLIAAGLLFFAQKNELQIAQADSQRKTAINAMHYSLEEAYYTQHGHYPTSIDESILKTVDPDLFTDPNGIKINQAGSDYRYEAIGCAENECKGYRLRANLVNESDYVKSNRDRD